MWSHVHVYRTSYISEKQTANFCSLKKQTLQTFVMKKWTLQGLEWDKWGRLLDGVVYQ